ncbi:hypothetical protein, partial [Janthinobacterium agaricidamnosum]|uniref:hypothetical protein n=1 Tax=Janthinobacterium agaricidamnosum TaxID=55508 RepID=UPI000AC13C30
MKTSPKPWKYIVGALLVLIILIPLWTLFVAQVIQPDSFILTQEQSMSSKTWPILRWLVILPVVIVALLFGARWVIASRNATEPRQQLTTQKVVPNEQARREYVLEVIGLGVTLDKYRQGKLWEALQKGDAYASIREQ